MEQEAVDLAILSDGSGFVSVEKAGTDGGPVASAHFEDLGAVLWLSRCERCDDGTIAADIHVYDWRDGDWVDSGGGGGDWTWPVGHVPADDVPNESFELIVELPDGRPLRLIPAYGPSGPQLRAELGGPDMLDMLSN